MNEEHSIGCNCGMCVNDDYSKKEQVKWYCPACDKLVANGCTEHDCPVTRQGTKMTRQEAIMMMPMGFENLPAALEALGLITFEKEKKKDNAIANQIGFTFSSLANSPRNDLTAIGFKFIHDLEAAG